MLAASFTFLLLVLPPNAQTVPAGPVAAAPTAPDEHVVMDVVFWAMPGPVNDTCLQLPPGHLNVTLHLEDGGTVRTVHFWLFPYWYRAADAGADIQTIVTRDPSTFEATLAGGRYCYAFTIDPMASSTAGHDAGSQAQLVALRVTHTQQ